MEMHDGWSSRPARRGPSAGVVIFLALFFGLIGGAGGMLLASWANRQYGMGMLPSVTPSVAGHPARTSDAGPGVAPAGSSFSDIADRLNRSVVHITSTSDKLDPLTMFFGGGPQRQTGIGTGVIVDASGYILTNFHVVGEAKALTVKILGSKDEDPKEYPARVIGGDKQEDLALIKVEAKGLQPAVFGNSDQLRPGDPVMAIGNPFGFEHTVSVGVVSALNRKLDVDETVTLRNMIQTDASINPGNSGGPLVNARGEVVGINSAIFVGNGSGPQANGIGFSIPSNHAKKVMELFRQNKKVQHPYIGIQYRLVTDEVRRTERLPRVTGVIVKDVLPSGPAAKAGIKVDDIILSADGKALRDQNVLSDYVNSKDVGTPIKLETMRWNPDKGDWEKRTVSVKSAEKPDNFENRMRERLQGQQPQPQQPQGAPDGGQQRPEEAFPFPFPF